MSISNKFYPESQSDRKVFCERLAVLRKESGLSQSQLANEMNSLKGTNYSLKNISSWESGTALPPLTLLPALAFIFEVPMMTFFKTEKFENSEHTKSKNHRHKNLHNLSTLFEDNPKEAFYELLNQFEEVQGELVVSEMALKSLEKDYKEIEKIFKKK